MQSAVPPALPTVTWGEPREGALRVLRVLKRLVEARDATRKDARKKIGHTLQRTKTFAVLASAGQAVTGESDIQDFKGANGRVVEQVRLLCEALRPMPFGMSWDASCIKHVVREAQYIKRVKDTVFSLEGRDDGLWVVLTGKVSVLGNTKGRRRLRVAVESARDLVGDSAMDRLDPYVIVRFPNTRKKLVTAVQDNAGSNPVWNFVGSIDYDKETELEFLVMEDDEYSKDDVIGSASVHSRHFSDGFDGELELKQPKKRGAPDNAAPLEPGGYLKVSISWEQVDDGEVAFPRRRPSKEEGGPSKLNLMRGAMNAARLVIGLSASAHKTQQEALKGPGEFFGEESLGMKSQGSVLCVEDCEFMFVNRTHVAHCLRRVKEERNQELDDFLRKWLPGARDVDLKTFEAFSASFQPAAFPRGHTFCTEGQCPEQKQIFVLRCGQCGLYCTSKGTRKRLQVGVVGEGQALGYASALFNIAEPYTVIAMSETVEVYQISLSDRPASTWPREIVKPLYALLKARSEHHKRRNESLEAAEKDNAERAKDKGVRSLPDLGESPFIRNKTASSRVKITALKERLNSRGPAGDYVVFALDPFDAVSSLRKGDRTMPSSSSTPALTLPPLR